MVEHLPAMMPNLHIRLGGSSRYGFGDAMFSAPQVTLIGPTMSSYRMVLEPGLHLVAIGFLPEGWMRFIGTPARELSDQMVDGAAIWGDRAIDRLLDQLCGQTNPGRIARLVEQFLAQSVRLRPDAHSPTVSAVNHWLEHSPGLDLSDLQSLMHVGDRHMRRMVMESHGASPKALAIKYRALRAAAAMAVHGAPAVQRAVTPYSDQAHFIRDFRRFTGWTPRTFVVEAGNTAAYTLAGRRQAGIIRPLSLWS